MHLKLWSRNQLELTKRFFNQCQLPKLYWFQKYKSPALRPCLKSRVFEFMIYFSVRSRNLKDINKFVLKLNVLYFFQLRQLIQKYHDLRRTFGNFYLTVIFCKISKVKWRDIEETSTQDIKLSRVMFKGKRIFIEFFHFSVCLLIQPKKKSVHAFQSHWRTEWICGNKSCVVFISGKLLH